MATASIRQRSFREPPPASPECERAILGGLLLEPERASELATLVSAGDFFEPRHGTIFSKMLALYNEGNPIDLRTLQAELERTDQLDSVGGVSYLTSLDLDMPDLSSLESYAKIVRLTATRRRALDALTELEAALRSGEGIQASMDKLNKECAVIQTTVNLRVYEAVDFINLDIPPRKWVVPELIQERDICGMHAFRGVGKTLLGLSLGYAVSSGSAFLRYRSTEPHGVLFVGGEMPAPELKARLAEIILGADKAPSAPFRILSADLQDPPLPSLATSAGQAAVEAQLDDVDLVILDSVSTLFGSEFSENEDRSWDAPQSWLLSLRRKGFTVLVIYHEGKGGQQRGTSKREDVLSQVIRLKRPSDYRASEGARFEVQLTKARGLYGHAAEPFEARYETDENGAAIWTWRPLGDVKKAQILDLWNSGVTKRRAIAKELGIGLGTVSRKIQKLRQEGQIVEQKAHFS